MPLGESVQNLIQQIKGEQILLPEFQRGYVWSRDQARELVKSLYKGYPTGHLLVWRTSAPGAVRGAQVTGDGHIQLLLDGQQRLTSLYTVFEGQAPPFYEGESLFFDLYFNVATEEFRFWQKTIMENDPTWMSVHEFLQEGIHNFIGRLPKMPDEAREIYTQQEVLARLSRLDAIRNHHYQIDILQGDELEIEEVVDIFNRVNSKGTPLSKADLAVAHICSLWPEARAEIRGFLKDMGTHGFDPEIAFAVRCIAAVACGSLLLEHSFFRVSAEEFKTAWKKVRTAFEYLVNVLRHDAYVDRISDLHSVNVLIPITVYLATHGATFDNERLKLRFLRWMYLAMLWGRYSGSAESTLQKDVATLEPTDPVDGLVDAISKERGRLHLEAADLDGASALSAVYKLSYIVARARGAKDWFTGVTLYQKAVGKSNGLESHHIFPLGLLKKAGYSAQQDKKLINEVANRAFLTQKANRNISMREPKVYLSDIEDRVPGALEAQSVPRDRSLWETDAYEDFLVARRTSLAKAINAFIDGLVPDKSPTTTPWLEELVSGGETPTFELKSSLRWDIKKDEENDALEHMTIKTVAGMLNASGGQLVIGVADNGEVLGLDKDYATFAGPQQDRDAFIHHVTQIVMSQLGPSVMAFVELTMHELDGKDVCLVTVKRSDFAVFCGKNEQFLVRAGTSTKEYSKAEMVKYIQKHWGAH